MLEINKLHINRTIIHRVFKKEGEQDYGISDYSENLFNLGDLELDTLKSRIGSAFSKSKRFFKLEIEKKDENSFFKYSSKMKNASDDEFIDLSKSISDLLAKSHNKKTIPSGLLIILNGYLENKHFVLVIKAEIQEAFTIKEIKKNKIIELVNDLFLSPAKDFYKIGFIVEDLIDDVDINKSYSCYMYDDNFSSGKRDLAEYFYNDFLGFQTNSNDKLLTKRFRTDMLNFIEKNVESFEDKRGLRLAIQTLYRENTNGVINPQEFAESHFSDNLLRMFGSEISSKYPHSFTKNLTLLDISLNRGQIKLKNDLKIEGPSNEIDRVKISNGEDFDIDNLKLQLEKGEIEQIVTIKSR